MDPAQTSFDAARALRTKGRHAEAAALLQTALFSTPTDAELHHEFGNTLRALGRHAEALASLREAVRLRADNPIFWLNLGVTHFECDRHAEALDCFQRALALAPHFPEAHNITGCTLLALGRSTEAGTHLQTALRLRPAYPAAHDNLGRCLRAQGRMVEAIASFEQSLRLQASPQPHSNALLALNYIPGVAPSLITERHGDWAHLYADRFAPPPSTQGTALHNARATRLRIGYVSGDLCNHAVSFFLAPILANHDRARFEVTCYSNGLVRDSTTDRLRGLAEQWRDIARLDDETVARLIREDGIDILVDLSGHTAHNRLLVFARRPAPLQLSWIGYPSTTGLGTMDYRISDAHCIPPGNDSTQGTEKILRLADCFTCYEPPHDAPAPAPIPHDSHRHPPVFCSFSNIAKLSDPTLALWARILKALPGSRLLIKSPGADDAGAQERILRAFGSGGVSEKQIHFHGRPLPLREHLALYADCHVALDPFPYNGTTTTCEALLMGVPVVSLSGDSHVSRVGTSLLRCIGHGGWVAQDEHDYAEIACTLARDLPGLAVLRTKLRAALLRSPLCRAQAFTHHYESVLLSLALQSA